jgi:thiamine biosynthesis lipoprotein
VRIRAEGLAGPEAHAAIDGAFDVVATIHRLMSFHEPTSELSRLNRLAWRRPQPVSSHTRAVLERALDVARACDGLFDPTVAPVLVRHGHLPPPDARAADPAADWRDVEIDGEGRVAFARPLWIDLGGIAKGYAVDCALAHVEAQGASRVCVEAGGDLRLAGDGAERVFLAAPESGSARAVIEVENGAVASSGGGHARPSPSAHVDPRTGALGLGRFVSVAAPRCVDADALTKVVMAAGPAAAPVLARFRAHAFLFEAGGWTAPAVA